MKIPRLPDNKPRPYVPAFADERAKAADDPQYQPVVFYLRPMTENECDHYDEFKTRFEPESGKVLIEPNPEVDEQIFADHVAKIENLEFEDGEPIADAADFLAARKIMPRAYNPLYKEVLTAVRDLSTLSEGERKN